MDLPSPISGIRNCHAMGVDSLVLREWRGGGMLRVFLARKGHGLEPRSNGFPVAPHDHRFRIALRHLFGSVRHRRFYRGDGGRRYNRFRFTSALNGAEPVAERVGSVLLAERCEPLAGRACLGENEIHTIDVASDSAAWLVFEGVDRQPKSALFAVDDEFGFDASGMYQPMTSDEIGAAWDEVLSGVGK